MTHAEHTTGLRRSLLHKLWEPTPRVFKPTKTQNKRATKEPDLAILEARRLREMHGMACSAIAEHMTAIGVHMTPQRATNICNYITRSHLVPDDGRATPYTP